METGISLLLVSVFQLSSHQQHEDLQLTWRFVRFVPLQTAETHSYLTRLAELGRRPDRRPTCAPHSLPNASRTPSSTRSEPKFLLSMFPQNVGVKRARPALPPHLNCCFLFLPQQLKTIRDLIGRRAAAVHQRSSQDFTSSQRAGHE